MTREDQVEYFKKCHDCGRFVKKGLWVPTNHSWKKWALCSECHSNYDHPGDY